LPFPSGSIQEQTDYRQNERERKLWNYLKGFFQTITVWVVGATNYLLFGKTIAVGTDPYQFNGSIQISTISNTATPYLNLVRAKTTGGYIPDGETIGYIADSPVYWASGTIEFVASQSHTGAVAGTKIVFKTNPNGFKSLEAAGFINHNGNWVAGGNTFYVPSQAGVPSDTPEAQTGTVPMRIDETNNKAYIYSGGAWVALN
jgi:hypothetical protein